MMQGDPYLTLGPDGSDLHFRGGQPIMDRGLENAALISLFSGNGWCGNSLLETAIGSDFEQACNQPITRRALNEIRNAAERALVDEVFGDVTVQVRNPKGYRLEIGVQIKRTGSVLLLGREGGVWYYQAFEPAHGGLQPRLHGGGTSTLIVPDAPGPFNEQDIDFNINDWEFN